MLVDMPGIAAVVSACTFVEVSALTSFALSCVICDDVNALFARFRAQGLPPSERADSPVHQAPLDQTWGTREVYIDDPDGNTLCYQQR